jgi:hypothetical protein
MVLFDRLGDMRPSQPIGLLRAPMASMNSDRRHEAMPYETVYDVYFRSGMYPVHHIERK